MVSIYIFIIITTVIRWKNFRTEWKSLSKSNKKHKECSHPKSNPKPEGKIVPVLVLAHFVKDSLEHIDRASWSQENKWLSRKKAKKYATNQAWKMKHKLIDGVIANSPHNLECIYNMPDINDSIVAILFSVASPNSPPKATMGARQAKYRKRNDEMHCGWSPCRKSDM